MDGSKVKSKIKKPFIGTSPDGSIAKSRSADLGPCLAVEVDL